MGDEFVSIPNMEGHYTIREVAKQLGISYSTANNYVATGRLKAKRAGNNYMIPREEIENFEKRTSGRPRTSTPKWRFSPEGNLQIGTSVEASLREGVSEQAFMRALAKVKASGNHLFEGTIARYVLSNQQDLGRVQFLLIWRETVMPSPDAIEQALAALGKALANVLVWESASSSTQRIWMHT
jgi:excisionase family DNA binding protein